MPASPSSTDSFLALPNGSHRVKYRGAGSHNLHDFVLESDHHAIDVSLVLPHFRARAQPLGHRLGMYVGNDSSEPIRVKVCRNFTTARSTKFHLEVRSAANADITVWLPSDFRGHIHRSSQCKRVSFSAGFTNRIMQHVQLTQSRRPSVMSALSTVGGGGDDDVYVYSDIYVSDSDSELEREKAGASMLFGGPEEDEVVIHTAGHVKFRMWDIHTGEPEVRAKEACKRMFGFGWCTKRSAEVSIDWDFLLEDQ
ncbi:hypothetical protein BDW22DRAFT_1354104 [Trametopsis cervina]|nr:hypothetical protein BDW22DRAFT_1354104 [Trametopsis cervina]